MCLNLRKTCWKETRIRPVRCAPKSQLLSCSFSDTGYPTAKCFVILLSQEPWHAPTSQNLFQQPLPQSGGVSQRPYYQPAADGNPPRAQPTTQQQKLPQQIPFMPQPTAGARAGTKPALFVPSQHGSRTNPVLMPNSTSTSAIDASTRPQDVLEPRQTPVVSSRLSALKARLNSEKHCSSSDDTPSGPRYVATLLCYKYCVTVSQPAKLYCNTMRLMSAMTCAAVLGDELSFCAQEPECKSAQQAKLPRCGTIKWGICSTNQTSDPIHEQHQQPQATG